MKPSMFSQSGSMLIEALVALLVVGVGTFGVLKLNTVMLNGTGLSKTRAEALQIAQKRMEDIRNFSVEAGCPAEDTGSTETDAVTGVNASYNVGRTISSVISERVNVDIYVGWDGVSDPHADSDKRVVLSSVVACVGVGTSGMVGGNANALNGGTVPTPTGSARVGGRDNPTCSAGCTSVTNNTNNKPDNTKVNTTGDLVELVDTVTGKVLLTIEDGSAFSTISGRVYIEANNSGNAIVDPDGSTANDGTEASILDDNVFVLSSDASYCARIFPTDADSIVPSGASGNGIKYRYFDYNCYVSKGWWGNIGIVRLDNPNSNNRICLGDPAVSSGETSIWSKKTTLSISRGYRGYRQIDANGSTTDQNNFKTVGIGYSLSDGIVSLDYSAVNLGTSADTNNHDFLITVITGQGTCESSGNMTLVPGDTSTSNQFTSNLGRFYCMSGQCPSLTQTETTQTTVIHGTITNANGAVLTGIDPADCQTTPTFTAAGDGSSYSYSCTKSWTGFAGSAWQGGVTFVAGGTSTLCGPGTATVAPSGSTVVFTVNDSNAGNTISFADVQLGVTDIAINFSVQPSSCGTLGTPAPVWPTVPGSSNDALSWTPITGATGYKVKTCTDTAALSTTACTPNSTATSQAGTSYAPSISNNDRLCIIVAASNASGDGSYSVTPRCVRRDGGTYTHK